MKPFHWRRIARFAAVPVLTGVVFAGCCSAADAGGSGEADPGIEELRHRIRIQEERIARLERRLESGDDVLVRTNIRLSPTMLGWVDLLFGPNGGGYVRQPESGGLSIVKPPSAAPPPHDGRPGGE